MRLGVACALAGGELVPGDVEIDDGRVVAVGVGGSGRGLAAPGYVDLQVNGYGGIDLLSADEAAVLELGEALAATGVTAYQPTLVTSPVEQTLAALAAIGAAQSRTGPGAAVVGVHLEGPFLSPARAGVHPVELLRAPDLGLLRRLLDGGPVSCVTLAPELPGAGELIDELVRRGIVVALGHSDATAVEAGAAFARGARTVTHLFNAMRPIESREPGLAGAALADDRVAVQVIVDGVHLADAAVLLAWRAAAGRLAVASDAIAAAGLGDGRSRLGSTGVEVRDGVARRQDGVVAGGLSTIAHAVRRLHELGAPAADALDAATRMPAVILGRSDLGSLELGSVADLVVLDDSLDVVRVLRRGVDLYGQP